MDHAAELFEIATPETFRYMMIEFKEWSIDVLRKYLEARLSLDSVAWVARCVRSGQAVGHSAIFDIRRAHRTLEIGHTWYGEAFRGTWVNPACKLLMLGCVFETWEAVRVQLKCDARNATSRAALVKLGAVYEGTLRSNFILPDGTRRNTAYFSLLPEEWPPVREKLLARLQSA